MNRDGVECPPAPRPAGDDPDDRGGETRGTHQNRPTAARPEGMEGADQEEFQHDSVDRVNGDTDVDAEAYLEALADSELDRQVESYEASLVRDIQRGRRSEEVLARKLTRMMFTTAFHILRDGSRAEDARQEAWIRLSRGLSEVREPERIRSFANTTTMRVACTIRSRDSRHSAREVVAPEYESAVEQPGRPDLTVARALVALADIHRTVLFLTSLGYTSSEIGEAMGVSVGTVTQRICTARRRLRELLDDGAE